MNSLLNERKLDVKEIATDAHTQISASKSTSPWYFVCNDYHTYSVIIILSEFELIEKWLSHVFLGEKYPAIKHSYDIWHGKLLVMIEWDKY